MVALVEKTVEEVRENMKRGQLPRAFLEEYRIAPPESVEARKFHENMDRIARRIWPHSDYDDHAFRFLLSDDVVPNGSFEEDTDPAIIILSKGLIELLDTEDQIAAVLGHEIQHYRLEQTLGPGKNSKLEEYSADVWPVFWLYDAGYDPHEVTEVFVKLAELSEGQGVNIFRIFSDRHGLAKNRVKASKTGLAALDEINGGIGKRKPTPKNDELVSAVANAKHVSYTAKALEDAHYDQADNTGKLKILNDIYTNIWEYDDQGEVSLTYMKRLTDFCDVLSALRLDHDNPEEVEAFNIIAECMLFKKGQGSFNLHEAASKAWTGRGGKAPIGSMVEIAKYIQAFIDADTIEDARDAAEKFTALLDLKYRELLANHKGDDREKWSLGYNLTSIDWPGFRLPGIEAFFEAYENGKEIEAPWNKHLEWAHADDSHIIFRALHQMDTDDVRIYEPYDHATIKRYAYGHIEEGEPEELHGALSEPSGPGLKYGFVYLAADGTLHPTRNEEERVGKKDRGTSYESYRRDRITYELSNQKRRDEIPDVTLADIPERFGDYHAKYMMAAMLPHEDPQYNITEDWDRHINATQALVDRFEELLAEDRERHIDFVRGYFLESVFNKERKPVAVDVSYKTSTFRETPYVQFIKNDKFGIFEPRERIYALENMFYVEGTEFHEDDDPYKKSTFDLDYWRGAFNYTPAQNMDELFAILDRFGYVNLQGGSFADTGQNYKEMKFALGSEHDGRECLTTVIMAFLETIQFLETGTYSNDELVQLIIKLENFMLPKLSKAIRDHVDVTAMTDEVPLKDYISAYRVMEAGFLFPDQEARYHMAAKIIERVSAIQSPEERVEMAEHAMFQYVKQSGAKSPLRNSTLRSELKALWAEDILTLYGIDDSSEVFFKRGNEKIQQICEGNSERDAFDFVRDFADIVEAQEQLSLFCKEHLNKTDRDDMSRKGHAIAGAEGILDALSRNEFVRRQTIQFLSSPLTPDSIRDFSDILESSKALRWISGNVYGEDTPASTLRMVSQDLYTNFWQSRFHYRVVFMDQLLLPASQNEDEGVIEDVFNLVTKKLLPDELDYSAAAKALLKAYLKVTPSYQRSLLLSAMMVAVEQTENSEEEVSVGRRLAMVLEMKGPAGKKFGQAIHSNPKTPEDIREGTEHFKSMTEPGTRWDLWARMREVVPDHITDRIDHLGKVVGAASYFVTAKAQRNNKSSVFSLLRKNARNKAEEEFARLAKTAEILAKEDAEFAKISDVLIQSVNQARSDSQYETDCKYGAKQAKKAAKMYNGTIIRVDGYSFHFNAARWLNHGDEFKETEIVEGQHFNDLPARTAEEIKYKRALAKAHLTLEFNMIASGKGFDRDRHGAQLRVNGNKAGLFDHGLLDLKPPTKDDKQKLVKVLFAIYQAHQRNEGFSEATINAVRSFADEDGNIPPYLLKVQQGLLALADFYNCETDQRNVDGTNAKLLSSEDLQDVITAAFSRNVDLNIAWSLGQEFIQSHGFFKTISAAFKGLFKMAEGECPISIEQGEFYDAPNSKYHAPNTEIKTALAKWQSIDEVPSDPTELRLAA